MNKEITVSQIKNAPKHNSLNVLNITEENVDFVFDDKLQFPFPFTDTFGPRWLQHWWLLIIHL